MRLTIKNVGTFLMEKGLLSPKSIVDGDFMVTQSQNRNAIFRIHIRNGKSLFVKQLVSFDPQNSYFLQKDATCLWLIKNEKTFKSLSEFVPQYYGYDPEKQVLIVEYIPEAKNMEEIYQERKLLPPELLQQVAKILSAYHFTLDQKTLSNRSVQFFMRQLPWTFQFAASSGANSHIFDTAQGANPVVNYLKQNEEFITLMKHHHKEYQFSTLIHGDIKWVNFILPDINDAATLKLIDWELADIGDPLWDVAGIIQSLFTSKILMTAPNAPLQGGNSITEVQMNQTMAEIECLWSAYCRYQGFKEAAKQSGLKKTLQFAGMRLVQTAFEHNVMSPQILPNTIKLLQVSHSLMKGADILCEQIFKPNTVSYESVN
ncbi:MAG: phosphotransferase [Saprospiraceae bacterium]|nr:phosphotransferase [Saprospiraceae bacterium]